LFIVTQIDFLPTGILLKNLGLWLDPQTEVDAAWISHAHSDHARGYHRTVIGSPFTLDLYRMRWPEGEQKQKLDVAKWGQPIDWRGARLTAYPAGHILGAAQLLIEVEGERIVYTGDIKLRAPLCGEATEVIRCDRLIVESTFGLPIYHFLDREEARDRILKFARDTIVDRATPVFLGYPLGRGQEIAHVLCSAGIPTAIHGAIARFLPVYERAGYTFPGWKPYVAGVLDGAVVAVPGMRALFEASPRECRIAYVSGWAALANARARSGAEELIPYSDHADFEELLELVERSGAKTVDLVHGYTEPLARILQARGIDARAALAQAQRSEEDAA
jgi:Cft2 family RNA processing exonuclease